MKIAIIGTGISGLGATYILNKKHDITVFEKNAYIGGHSRTIDIQYGGHTHSVDTGFIVFNHRNYPLLTKLFQYLNVPTQKSDMSFGASIKNGTIEYGSKGMFSQKRNFLRTKFWGMVVDIIQFNRKAENYIDSQITLGELLDTMKMGTWFKEYYLQAMGAAIWSCSVETILQFPASTFINFFKNHGLLTVNDHPQWYTVSNGSRSYVQKITESFASKIKLNTGVQSVTRHADHVEIADIHGEQHIFDQVIFATHADDALNILKDATDDEQSVLGSFTYQHNDVVVHSDAAFMPKTKGSWASWIYLSEDFQDTKNVASLTYWMNNLQGIPDHSPIFVTLNPGRMPDEKSIYDRHVFKHPVFTLEAIQAQKRIPTIQGIKRTYFCGAWQRYGFHEDGLLSAVNICAQLGVDVPWK